MRKIGLLTWHYFHNFGSALQAFALQKTLKTLDYNSYFINYRDIKYGKENTYKISLKYVVSEISKFMPSKFQKRFYYPYISFLKNNLKQTKCFYDEKFLSEYGEKFDTIVCGSDQIWAPNVFNPIYMIDFVDGKKIKKISYAASIGLDNIPENLQEKYKKLLSDFSNISVREETGKILIKEKCGISATVVLDPTFLLKSCEYRKIEKEPIEIQENKKYIFCYFLNQNNKYSEIVKKYAAENDCEIIGYSACNKDTQWMKVYNNIGPCEFLWFIDNAQTVFTDSYHGTIFSLLFHKNFWTFERFSQDDSICQNSRIFQLAKMFDIGDRIIKNDSIIDTCKNIDYSEFEKNLELRKKNSIKFLKGALE